MNVQVAKANLLAGGDLRISVRAHPCLNTRQSELYLRLKY